MQAPWPLQQIANRIKGGWFDKAKSSKTKTPVHYTGGFLGALSAWATITGACNGARPLLLEHGLVWAFPFVDAPPVPKPCGLGNRDLFVAPLAPAVAVTAASTAALAASLRGITFSLEACAPLFSATAGENGLCVDWWWC